MTQRLDIPCIILAGGESRRFGSNKGLARLGHSSLIELVISRLKAQSSAPVAINCGPNSPYAMYGDGTVADRDYAGEGPLAGLLSGMRWAKNLGFPFLISAPLDCPFLPLDLIKRLNSVGAPSVSASSATRPHFVTGLWRTSDAKSLKRFLQSGQRSAQNWCQHCDANICEFDSFDEIDPFFNVNTLSDLETAGKLFGQLNHSSCKFI